MMKVRKFSSHRSVRFALRPLHMLRFIIATFYYGEYLFYLTVRESANNSQLRNMLLFFFFFYLSLKIRELSQNSLSLSQKKVSANTIEHEIPLFFFIQEWTPEAAELIHLIW